MLQRLLRKTRLGSYLAAPPLRPRYWTRSLAAARILWSGYGHLKSVRSMSSVDGAGPYPIDLTSEATNAEVARLRGMSWEAFREFVRRPDRRWYLLE